MTKSILTGESDVESLVGDREVGEEADLSRVVSKQAGTERRGQRGACQPPQGLREAAVLRHQQMVMRALEVEGVEGELDTWIRDEVRSSSYVWPLRKWKSLWGIPLLYIYVQILYSAREKNNYTMSLIIQWRQGLTLSGWVFGLMWNIISFHNAAYSINSLSSSLTTYQTHFTHAERASANKSVSIWCKRATKGDMTREQSCGVVALGQPLSTPVVHRQLVRQNKKATRWGEMTL